MNQLPIGIVDSGLGGYSIYHALQTRFPTSSWLFLADQIHAPYGDKSKEEIIEIMIGNVSWMRQLGIREVLLACNTASSNALDSLRHTFADMTFYGIIDVTVSPLSHQKRVGVLATEATVRSGAYTQSIAKSHPEMDVVEVSAKPLVGLIESLSDVQVIEAYLRSLLSSLNSLDTLILGCTHYPIIKPVIESVFDVKTMDSIDPILHLFSTKTLAEGKSWVVTSKDPTYLKEQIHRLFQVDEMVFSKEEVSPFEISHCQ